MLFSKSSLLTYKQCPHKFELVKLQGLEDVAGPEAMMGRHLHAVFDEYLTKIYEPEHDETRIRKDIMAYNNGALDVHLHNFAEFVLGMRATLIDKKLVRPIFAERLLEHDKYPIHGYVDAIFKDEAGETLVLDYKTGAYNSYKIPEYRLELSIYRELAARKQNINATHWGIFFTKAGVFWREKCNPTYFETEVLPLIAKIKDNIKKGGFEPVFSVLCLYCSLKGACKLYGGKKNW